MGLVGDFVGFGAFGHGDEDFQEIAFSQARRAVRNLRASASKTDLASLSLEDIEAEIQAARKITQ